LTAEDSAIFERYPFAVRKAAHIGDQRDARLMLDLGLARRDAFGLTVRDWVVLDTIYQGASPVAIHSGFVVREYSADDFEHVVMASECPHGVDLDMLADHPSACFECVADSVDMVWDARFDAVQRSGTGLPGSIEEC
jgi:hypothetical protein